MPFFRAVAATSVIATTVLFTTEPVRANGRFPEAQAIESVPGDPSTLFLRTTFGVLVSHDAGLHWRYICERALGYEGQWDPPIAVTRDGRLWVGLEDGLRVTSNGCEVAVVPELDGQMVKDLTVDARGETLFAITGAPGKRSFVWRRSGGPKATFERLAGMDDINLMTIEVAPSLPSRVYLSGQPYATIRGQIYRSDDGGKTFRTDIGDAAPDTGTGSRALIADGPFFIGGIDPRDPSRVLVRHLHANGSDLLLTRDGGVTFKNVLHMASAMYGFAKSADGATYFAGSGLPEHGIFRSTDRGEHFERSSQNGVLCLHAAAPDALFVCQNALSLGAPAVGVSRDQGKSVTMLARFADIEGPVACASSAAAREAGTDLCAGSWAATRAWLAPDAGTPPANGADAGKPRRRKRDGGAGDSDGGDVQATPSKGHRSTCGCGVVGTRAPLAELWWLLACLLPLGVRANARALRGSTNTR